MSRRRSSVQGIPTTSPSKQSNTNLDDYTSEEAAERFISWVRHKKEAEIAYGLAQGWDVNIKDSSGNSPLLVACQNGHVTIAEYLVQQGADINAKNNKGNTSLHYCIAYKFSDIASMLIKEGADEFAVNNEGLSPYEGLISADLEKL